MQRPARLVLLGTMLTLAAPLALAQTAGGKPAAIDPVVAKPADPAGASAQPAQGQPTEGVQSDYDYRIVQVYDLSSLAASLSGPDLPPGQVESKLVEALSQEFDLHVSPITRSIYLIGCSTPTHARIADLLAQLRVNSAERFRVQLVTLTLPNDKVPPIGSTLAFASSSTGSRVDHIVQQRSSTMFECSKSETYIADWQPIVGNDSVGYQPLSKTTTSGVNARIYLGTASSSDVEIRMDGEVVDSKVANIELPLAQGGAKLTIGLPMTQRRSVHAETVVPMGAPTVLSVSTGFEPDESLVTIARIERVK